MKNEIKVCIKQLLNAGFRIDPSSLDKILQFNDFCEAVQMFLVNPKIPRGSVINIEDLLLIIKREKIDNSFKNQKDTLANEHKSKPLTSEFIKNDFDKLQPISKNIVQTPDSMLQGLQNYESKIKIDWVPQISNTSLGDISNFVQYFQNRLQQLSHFFKGRRDISNLIKIKRAFMVKKHTPVSVIGIVTEKKYYLEGGAVLHLEDLSCEKILIASIPKQNQKLINDSKVILNDCIICVQGETISEGRVLITKIILPDIPKFNKPNKALIPVHVAFLSDIHIGSSNFLNLAFENFIKFLNGEYGSNKMKALGKQTKYVLFAGDIIDGVGIYPGQEAQLTIKGVRAQYDKFSEYLEMIPNDVQIVVIPGNHDHVRSAEPQPAIKREYAPRLYDLNNVHILPNPSQISIHDVKILLYHCTSIPDILNNIPGLLVEKPTKIMEKMLLFRHLAPLWGGKTPIAPEPIDNLIISSIPDIFHGGHMHINDFSNYHGVTIVNSGTMQSQTKYQKNLNIVPTPGKVTVINLKTLQPNFLDFTINATTERQ